MKKHNFTVIIEWDEDSHLYVAEVPGLPACHTQGKSLDELMKNIKESIELSLEVQKEKFIQIPKFVGIQQIEV